jgi:hypothetical protein
MILNEAPALGVQPGFHKGNPHAARGLTLEEVGLSRSR